MDSARTVWAQGINYSEEHLEALTLISEEAQRRGLEVSLTPGDLAVWSDEFERVGAADLEQRVDAIRDEMYGPSLSGMLSAFFEGDDETDSAAKIENGGVYARRSPSRDWRFLGAAPKGSTAEDIAEWFRAQIQGHIRGVDSPCE